MLVVRAFLLSLPFKGVWFGSLSMMLASGRDSRWGSRNIHLQAAIPSLSFSLILLINKESSLPCTTNPAWRDAVEQFLPSIPPSSTLTSLQAGSQSLSSLSIPLESKLCKPRLGRWKDLLHSVLLHPEPTSHGLWGRSH